MSTRYELAFAPPGIRSLMAKGREAIIRLSSTTPFHALHVGELVNPTVWESYDGPDCLRITAIEHLVTRRGDEVIDGIVVYTVPLEASSVIPLGQLP